MTLNIRYYATIMVALCTLTPRIGAEVNGLGLHGSVDSSRHLGSGIGTSSYDAIHGGGTIRQARNTVYDDTFKGSGGYVIPRDHYGHNFATGSSRRIGVLRNLGYPAFKTPMKYPRSGIFSSTSSSLHGGSSSGTAGSAAAFGTSAAGVAQSSSLQDGTAGATSGSAATHNVYGANRAKGSSTEGGTSSSSGGYGAATGLGHSNYHKGQFEIGNIGAQNGYSGYSSGGKAGHYVGNNRPETYTGGYAIEHSGITGLVDYTGHTDNYRYVDTHALGSNGVSEGYDDGNTFGQLGSSVNSNLFGGHRYEGANALGGTIESYKQVSPNTLGSKASTYKNNAGKSPASYVGGFTSDGANINRNYVDVYGEGGIGSYESGAIYGGRGVYAGSGYDGFGYTKETGHSNNVGHIGYEGVGILSDINESVGAHGRGVISGGDQHGKQDSAGTVNYLGDGFEEQWANIYAPAVMGGGDSIEGMGTHIGGHTFDNTHTTHSGKDTGISGGAGRYTNLLIGSSSSSGHGGSSSATSGYGAALAASAEGRVHSSSSYEGASEATSGLAAAMGMHGKNKALGSSSEKGTSTGTGGMAAANALGGIKTRMGTFGSSSSSDHGGSSTGTSGFGAAMGVSTFGRAQSNSLHDGTSGATSGLGATQSLYGRNRASGSSNTGGTSSSTGGYGAASGLGYNLGGNKMGDFGRIEMPQSAIYGGTLRYRNPYGEDQTLMGRYTGGRFGAPYGSYSSY